jgi:NAD(P)-dependent dehydrogenase (short-subunit alcohol dehydrogenase family)
MMAGEEGAGTPDHLETGGRGAHLLADRALLPPRSVSNAVLWLASDESADVSGLELVVDAGHMLMPGIDAAVVAESALRDAEAR